MFLAQSWLVIQGELAFIGQVGLGLAGLSLAQLVADFGGTFILSRQAARGRGDGYFASANIVRVIVGLLAAGILLAVALYAGGPIEKAVIVGGTAAICFWSVNLVGMLDGLGRSSISGPISGLSWLFASIGLFLHDESRPVESGVLIGALFSVGAAFTVCWQYIIAYRSGRRVISARPNLAEMREFAREGGYYSLANAPGQFYGRGLILISTIFLGADITGAVVYARNLVMVATQGITFIRRVEFPALARRLSCDTLDVRSMLRLQWWSICGSVVYLAFVLLALPFIPTFVSDSSADAIPVALLCLSLPIPIWALSSSFQQAFLAVGDTRIYALVGNIGLVIATSVILGTIGVVGVYALMAGELVTYMCQAGMYYWCYRKMLPAREIGPKVA